MAYLLTNVSNTDMDTLVSSLAHEANGDFKEVSRNYPNLGGTAVDGVHLRTNTAHFAKELKKYLPDVKVGVPLNQIKERMIREIEPIFSFAYVYRPSDMYVMGAIGYGVLGDASESKFLIKSNAVENRMFKDYNKNYRCKASVNLIKAVQNALGYFHKPSENKVAELLIEDYTSYAQRFVITAANDQAKKMADVAGNMLKAAFHIEGVNNNYNSVNEALCRQIAHELNKYADGRETGTGKLFECRSHYQEVRDILPHNIMGIAAEGINRMYFDYFRLVDAKYDLCMVYANKDSNGELASYNISPIGTKLTRGRLNDNQLLDAFKPTQVAVGEVDPEIASKVATLSMLEKNEYTPTVGVKFKGDIFFVETNVEELGDEYYENKE